MARASAAARPSGNQDRAIGTASGGGEGSRGQSSLQADAERDGGDDAGVVGSGAKGPKKPGFSGFRRHSTRSLPDSVILNAE
jgi:hypothetical protein